MTKQNSIMKSSNKKFINDGVMPVAKITAVIFVTAIVTGCAGAAKINDIEVTAVDSSRSPAKHHCIGLKLEKCLQRIEAPYSRTVEGDKEIITVTGDKWLKKGGAVGLYGADLPLSVPAEKEKIVFIAVNGIVRHSYQTIQHVSGKGFYIANVGHGSPIGGGSGEICEEWGSKSRGYCSSARIEGNKFYQVRNLAVGTPISEFTAQKPLRITNMGKSNIGTTMEYCYRHYASKGNWYFIVSEETGLIDRVTYNRECRAEWMKRFSNIPTVEVYRQRM